MPIHPSLTSRNMAETTRGDLSWEFDFRHAGEGPCKNAPLRDISIRATLGADDLPEYVCTVDHDCAGFSSPDAIHERPND